jgi:DNA-binding CsgD family transcriptional regulator
MLHDSHQRRLGLVRRVLEGARVDSAALGYPLDALHLGLVGWGAPDVADTVRAFGEQLGELTLVVRAGEELAWGWTARRSPFARLEPREMAHLLGDGAFVAVGTPATGIEGFQRTHRQALAAQRIALRLSQQVTLYEHVALEAMASEDEASCEAFIVQELGPLAADDGRAARLRETLRAYIATGHNAASTAAVLGIHDQTVRYQLRSIETLLGRPITSRLAEIDLALRLHALFHRAREHGGSRPTGPLLTAVA